MFSFLAWLIFVGLSCVAIVIKKRLDDLSYGSIQSTTDSKNQETPHSTSLIQVNHNSNKLTQSKNKYDIIEAEIIENEPKRYDVVLRKNTQPSYDTNSIRYRKGDRLRDLADDTYKPRRTRRPTDRQIRACEKIARQKGLWLPSNYDSDWEIASGFISKFGNKF